MKCTCMCVSFAWKVTLRMGGCDLGLQVCLDIRKVRLDCSLPRSFQGKAGYGTEKGMVSCERWNGEESDMSKNPDKRKQARELTNLAGGRSRR